MMNLFFLLEDFHQSKYLLTKNSLEQGLIIVTFSEISRTARIPIISEIKENDSIIL